MKKTYTIYKNLGETPLQALDRLRESEGLGNEVKMTYAGRLDPLAEGELLILVGEECKKKEEYLGLDKEYEVEILLGVSTDTGDVMGIILRDQAQDNHTQAIPTLLRSGQLSSDLGQLKELSSKPKSCGRPSGDVLRSVLRKLVGKVSWPYPAFSSKTVQGKPLFLWALEGKLGEIVAPLRESEIYELELLSTPSTKLSMSELRERVHTKINSIKKVPENVVNGKDTKRLGQDFRRAEVLQGWADFFTKCPRRLLGHPEEVELTIIKVRCKCSSGTYMRTLAQKVGEELGVPALALSIVRTEIVM